MTKSLAAWREHQIRTFEPTDLTRAVDDGDRHPVEAAQEIGQIITDLLNEIDRLRAAARAQQEQP